jgi:hypothetical protein
MQTLQQNVSSLSTIYYTMVIAALSNKNKNMSSCVQSANVACTVPSKGAVDHVVLEIVAALNDLSAVQFDVDTTSSSPSASVTTYSAFTGLSQQAVASGLAGSVRLLCGNGNPVCGATDTDVATVASWIQAAEQTVLPMVRHGTFSIFYLLYLFECMVAGVVVLSKLCDIC